MGERTIAQNGGPAGFCECGPLGRFNQEASMNDDTQAIHGYSGNCPKPPLPSRVPHAVAVFVKVGNDNRLHEDLSAGRERPFSAMQEMLCCLAHMYFEVCSGVTDRKPGDLFDLVLTLKPRE